MGSTHYLIFRFFSLFLPIPPFIYLLSLSPCLFPPPFLHFLPRPLSLSLLHFYLLLPPSFSFFPCLTRNSLSLPASFAYHFYFPRYPFLYTVILFHLYFPSVFYSSHLVPFSIPKRIFSGYQFTTIHPSYGFPKSPLPHPITCPSSSPRLKAAGQNLLVCINGPQKIILSSISPLVHPISPLRPLHIARVYIHGLGLCAVLLYLLGCLDWCAQLSLAGPRIQTWPSKTRFQSEVTWFLPSEVNVLKPHNLSPSFSWFIYCKPQICASIFWVEYCHELHDSTSDVNKCQLFPVVDCFW